MRRRKIRRRRPGRTTAVNPTDPHAATVGVGSARRAQVTALEAELARLVQPRARGGSDTRVSRLSSTGSAQRRDDSASHCNETKTLISAFSSIFHFPP